MALQFSNSALGTIHYFENANGENMEDPVNIFGEKGNDNFTC